MYTPKQRLVFYTIGLIPILHFAFVGMHQLNLNKNTWLYVYPYFDQSWSLFVPPPTNSYYLLICDEKGNNKLSHHKEFASAFAWPGEELVFNALNNSAYYAGASWNESDPGKQMFRNMLEKLVLKNDQFSNIGNRARVYPVNGITLSPDTRIPY